MKKSLIALAALASIGTAYAQSSVTLGGSVGFGYSKDAASKGLETTDATISVNVVEDLGGGLKASGKLSFEAFGRQTANVTNTDAFLTLSNGALSFTAASMEVTADSRRGDVSNVSNEKGFDQSGYNLANNNMDLVSVSYAIGGGVTAGVSYAELANASGTATISTSGTLGDYTATDKITKVFASYANGPMTAFASYAMASGTQTDTAVAAGYKDSQAAVAASYNFGVAKVGAGFQTQGAGADSTSIISVNVPLGAVDVGAAFVKFGDVRAYIVGGNYAFSKTLSVRAGYQSSDVASLDKSYRVKLVKSF